jgi:hypothetical protein
MRHLLALSPVMLPGIAAAHPGDHRHGEDAGLLSAVLHLADAADPALLAVGAGGIGLLVWAAFKWPAR